VMSIFLLVVFVFLPSFITIFYCIRFKKLSDESFEAKWGSPYEGLRTNDRSILFFPVFFLARRYAFTVMAFWMEDYGCL